MTLPVAGAYDWRHELKQALNETALTNRLLRELLRERDEVNRSNIIAEIGLVQQQHTQRLNDLRNFKKP